MSATLADDSIFVSALGLKKDDVTNIITPDKANDIGDRLILFPQHLNSNITDDEIKEKIVLLSERYNVLIIVPSRERGKFWDDTEKNIIDKENIEKIVKELKQRHVGLVILVNRYDGIDLPDDACRLLVIDGLPPLRSEYDKYVQSINPGSTLLLREQMQRIEQGMGRGVRSNSDSCCIVLMGSKLADVLLRNKGSLFFSKATMEQYQLSKELCDLLMQENSTPSIDEIFALANFSLNRQIEWIQKSRERLSNIVYETVSSISDTTVALRLAFEFACCCQWKNAAGEISNAANNELDEKNCGYLMQIKAEYTNFYDKIKAQQILLSARKLNGGVLMPMEGIQYDKLLNSKEQAKGVKEYFVNVSDNPNECIIHINSVLDMLAFSPDANEFERALMEAGEILGFDSSRPDKATSGKGPDNLWAIEDNKYLVIECKSGAICETISKDYCNQLGGSERWFKAEYGNGYQCVPVIIHPSSVLDSLATQVQGMKIITPELLDKMKKRIKSFSAELIQNVDLQDEDKINALLALYKLRGRDIVNEYMTDINGFSS